MCAKNLCSGAKMTATVETAQRIANELILDESRGPGDLDNAMRRIERKHGLDYWLLWALRYRAPKDILLGQWTQLVGAYEAERERQRRLYEHERQMAEAMGVSPALVSTADFVAGGMGSEER